MEPNARSLDLLSHSLETALGMTGCGSGPAPAMVLHYKQKTCD